MKKDKIIYWTSTILMIVTGAMAAPMYFTYPPFIEAFKILGFPDYFRIELGVFKIIGALAVLIPMVPIRLKEWAYAGFGIVFISAFIAHGVVDGIGKAMPAILPLVLLIISNIYLHKTKVNEKLA